MSKKCCSHKHEEPEEKCCPSDELKKDSVIEQTETAEESNTEDSIKEAPQEDPLAKLKKEADEYKDKYLRLLAESENIRKRMQKERQELIQYALQNLVVEFLHPIDHLENALQFTDQLTGEVKNWAIGFQMILQQFKDVLATNGVTPIQAMGKDFDPHIHEAIEMIESNDVAPGKVVQESAKGYKMGERTIRPSRVKVSRSPEINENTENA